MSTGTIFLPAVAISKKAFRRTCFHLCILIFFIFPFQSFSQVINCDEVPVTLIVSYFGRTELPSILCGDQVYFSVPGLFDFLQIKNEYSPDFKEISGFLEHQDDTFLINEPAKRITYKNKVFPIDSSDIIRTRTDLFLKADHFTSIFGLQNEFSPRNLAATLVSEFELPAVKVAKRKQMRENLRKVRGEFLADTTIKRDRPLVHFGAAAWNVNTTQRTDGQFHNRIGLGLGGLLAGGEFTGNVNYSSDMEFTSRNLFYQWRHVNNQQELFRQFTLGKIASGAISSIFHPVVGAQVTNAPTFVKRSFGTFTLSDHTKPDWIVELYINNILIDYTQADASGFFSFDVPLTYGITQISLRYYGPWGEEEISNQQFHIPFHFLSSGEFQYNLSSGIVEDGKNSKFFQGRADYGLTGRITIGGGMEYLSSLEENPVIPFLNTSVRLPENILVSGEYMFEVGYKGNLSYTTPSSLRLDLSYRKFEEEQKAVRFSFLEERKASLTFPLQLSKFIGTSRFNFQQNLLRNNSYTHIEWLLSGSAWGFRANLTNTAFLNSYSDPLVYSRLSTAIRLPGKFVFSPRVEYEYLRDGLTSLEVELRKRFFKRVNFQTSYIKNFRFDQYYINVGLNFDLGFTRLGMNSSTNKRYTSFSQFAGGSIMLEPNDHTWAFDHRPMMGRGSIKFDPFLDENGNNLKDQNESVIEGVNVHIQGGGVREQIPGGVTIFKGLEPYISYYFTLDTRNLKNIAWQVDHESMEIFINPNQMKVIEIPVKVVGEVAGFVKLGAGGIGGIKVNIFDSQGTLQTNVISEADGYFSYMGLKSGEYTARVDKEQLEKLDLEVKGDFSFNIHNTREGDYVDNLEFYLIEAEEDQIAVEQMASEGYQELERGADVPEEEELNPKLQASEVPEKEEESLAAVKAPNDKVVRNEGVMYKVQFLTSKNALTEEGSRLKGLRHVSREKTAEGFRYLWGETRLPGEATKLQNELRRSGFKDAYVVHYYNGERISVKKAVSIRNGNSQVGIFPPVIDYGISKKTKNAFSQNEHVGLDFKVQIAASKVQLQLTDTRFMGVEGVEEYRHEGMYKYVLGNFRFFGEANQFKNALREQGIPDAFVVPFRDNKRMARGQARGYIYFRDSSLKGIGGISVQIVDAAEKVVSTTLSEADGSFITPNLLPGDYTLKLDVEELNRIGMKTEKPEVFITIDEEGHLQNTGIEFFIRAENNRPSHSSSGDINEGLVFKIQVLASVPKLPVGHPLLKGLKDVERYKHNGLFKYTVGESIRLEEIRKMRNAVLRQGFEDAFIVPFLNGVRVNLQEMYGQVLLHAGSEKQGLEGIDIYIFDKDGEQVTHLVSGRDGKISFIGLKPGRYTAKLDMDQIKKLRLRTEETVLKFEIQRNAEGKIKDPVIFTLEKVVTYFPKTESTDIPIEYRIQLAASNVPLGPNHPTLRGLQHVSMYRHNNMYKYTIGSTHSLREAKDLLKKLEATHAFSLFIVGFKEGNRVMVVE